MQVAASVALLALGGLAIRSLTASAPAIAADARQILAADFDFAQVRPAAARSGLFVDSILADLGAGTAIGTRLRVRTGQYVDVVGVVSDSQRDSDGAPLPMLFLPLPSTVPAAIFLIVRAKDVKAAKQAIRAAVTSVDPSVPIVRMDTMEARLDERSRGFRALVSMAVTVGIVSIALAGAGLHSPLS